jgi:GNAT superfamily N-acetyltransferase
MWALVKKLSGTLSNGRLFSGHPDLEELDLDRDYPDIDRLLAEEEWPFLRSDLAVSHAQPGATAFVARKNGAFAGFFLTHAFGAVGYLDMMIVAPEFRRAGVARPLYYTTLHALSRQGVSSFVVHTTRDSARMIRLLGFRPGWTFTLLRREPGAAAWSAGARGPGRIAALGAPDLRGLLDLDAQVFGLSREPWLRALLEQPGHRFFGLRHRGVLRASVCLRPRREGSLALDSVNAQDDDARAHLVAEVVAVHADRRLDCFVRTGSPLHAVLQDLGFAVPPFFMPIGPLVEWRKGRTGPVGTSPFVQCLSWL